MNDTGPIAVFGAGGETGMRLLRFAHAREQAIIHWAGVVGCAEITSATLLARSDIPTRTIAGVIALARA